MPLLTRTLIPIAALPVAGASAHALGRESDIMPQRNIASDWKKRGLIEDLATGIPFVGAIFAGLFLSRFFFIVALITFGIGFTLQRIRFRRCICQTCGARLHRRMKDDSPITFYCSDCDTIWTTGLVQDGPSCWRSTLLALGGCF